MRLIGEARQKKRPAILWLSILCLLSSSLACVRAVDDDEWRFEGGHLKIVSKPVTEGVVNEPYFYKLSVNQEAECVLLESPRWMKMEGNEIHGTPYHISNAEIGRDYVKIGCFNERIEKGQPKIDVALQRFSLEIEPGVFRGKTYDHVQFIDIFSDYDGDGIDDTGPEDVVLLCETGYCPALSRETDYLERKAVGIKNAFDTLVDLVGIGFLDEFNPPVEVHLRRDSTCTQGVDTGLYVWGYVSNLNIICIYDDFREPESIESNGVEIHEYLHLLLTGHMAGGFQEFFTYPYGYILSNYDGKIELNDFNDLGKLFVMRRESVFLYKLNEAYPDRVNIENMSVFFRMLREEYFSQSVFEYKSNRPIPIAIIKCIFDAFVGDNTYSFFADYVCSDTDVRSPVMCCNENTGLDPRGWGSCPSSSLLYINEEFCGFDY